MTSPKDCDRPERAAAATRRVAAWLQKHAPDVASELNPPASEADVQALALLGDR